MHVIATLLVAGGASLTAVFGPHSSDPASLEELKEKLRKAQTHDRINKLCPKRHGFVKD